VYLWSDYSLLLSWLSAVRAGRRGEVSGGGGLEVGCVGYVGRGGGVSGGVRWLLLLGLGD